MIKFYKELLEKDTTLQMVIAVEELSELQKEICKFIRGKENLDNIKEELADVIIMLEQIMVLFNINKTDLLKIKLSKLQRTKRRLKDDR